MDGGMYERGWRESCRQRAATACHVLGGGKRDAMAAEAGAWREAQGEWQACVSWLHVQGSVFSFGPKSDCCLVPRTKNAHTCMRQIPQCAFAPTALQPPTMPPLQRVYTLRHPLRIGETASREVVHAPSCVVVEEQHMHTQNAGSKQICSDTRALLPSWRCLTNFNNRHVQQQTSAA